MAGIGDILALDLAATAFDTAATETPAAAVTYTPVTGAASTPDAVIVVDSEDAVTGPDGEVRTRFATAHIQKTDLTTPVKGDTLTHATEDWTVQSFFTPAPGLWELRLARRNIAERARESHRMRR